MAIGSFALHGYGQHRSPFNSGGAGKYLLVASGARQTASQLLAAAMGLVRVIHFELSVGR